MRFDEGEPRTVDELLGLVLGWASSAGIAEGRGGYPGGTAAPGWAEYVRTQRRIVAVYRAAVAVHGEPSEARARLLRCYEERFGPDIRRLGEDHEGHVDEMAGRLVYSLPSAAGFDRTTFSCGIREEDLGVLRADPRRRAILEAAARARLERSSLPGGGPVTELDFAGLAARILHSTAAELRNFIVTFRRESGADIDVPTRP